MLRGADEVEVLPLDLIHHGVHIGLAHDALHHVAADHIGRDTEGKALVDHEVPGIGQHRLMEAGDIAQQVVEAVAGDPTGGVHINAAKPLHDLGMVGDVESGHSRFAEPLHLHVAAVVRADGHRGVDDIGDHHHDLVDLRLQVRLLLLQLRQPGGVGLDLLLGGLRLLELGRVLLGLTHQHAHLLAQGVALGPQLAGLGDGGPVFAVQRQDLVHQGELLLLVLLFDIFPDSVRVIPNEFDV